MLGEQEQQTNLAKETLIPANQNQNRLPQVPVLIWNYSMQFHIRNMEEEVLTFTVYESCLYTPDGSVIFFKSAVCTIAILLQNFWEKRN